MTNTEKEKEKVENSSLSQNNEQYWLTVNASTLRQRPSHSYDAPPIEAPLPRPYVPGGGPPNRFNPQFSSMHYEASVENAQTAHTTPHNGQQYVPEHTQLRRKSEPYVPQEQPRPLVPLCTQGTQQVVSPKRTNAGIENHRIQQPVDRPPPVLAAPTVGGPSHTVSTSQQKPSGLRGSSPIVKFPPPAAPSPTAGLEALYPPPPPAAHTESPPRRRLSSSDKSTSSTSSGRHSGGGSSSSPHDPTGSNSRQRTFSDSVVASIDMKDIKLLHVIGGGAFGQVWKASWQGTPVAVKVLSSVCQRSASEEELRVFTDEVNMLARLRHPNICLFLGASLRAPNRYIVTEIVSRGSLWEALRTPNLFSDSTPSSVESFHWPWWVIRRVLHGTLRGLVYLHGNQPPIIHRDLKSANLLLDDSFHVKICDFGLARLRDFSQAMTANVGTAQWTAPEVLAGKEYNELADIFSMGVVFWEMLTGRCPYDNTSNQMEIAVDVAYKKKRPPLPPNCPPRVTEFITTCWADQPTDRMSAVVALENLDSIIPS
eukprot:CAMPEP_0185029326 /NCGR_PEP_ID=MMETSP1103-20130426/15559_1 /TAXON_ID=36769 /ORGANISM="Paraphysomonas bandaiensis, Strain Caron Lab Isolate" /LENGTH=539 /DNA_ID=CAMNT_0027564017 /DNA_START=88 /DNA_END=1707 /DNA_ORIENTATION=+